MKLEHYLFIFGVVMVATGVGAIKWFLAPIFIGVVLMTVAYMAMRSPAYAQSTSNS